MKCTWTYLHNSRDYFSNCGFTYHRQNPDDLKKNGILYCAHCGKKIVEVDQDNYTEFGTGIED